MTETTTSLAFTGNDDADRLLVSEPLALLIGFELDQQVTVQKAFSGPAVLKERIGHLDAARIAAMDPAELDQVFRTPPALHRFPGAMAGESRSSAGRSPTTTATTPAGSGPRRPAARTSRRGCWACRASAR